MHILRTLVTLVRFSSRVRRVLEENQADVVVAMSVKSLVYGVLAGRKAGAKVVWSINDRISPDYLPPFVVPVLRHVVPRLVHGIVVNSEATLETIRPGRTPVLVSHPPIALDERHFAGPGEPVRSVVCVGRLAPWKAQDNFLRAFAEVFGGTDTRATVVGGALFGEVAYGAPLLIWRKPSASPTRWSSPGTSRTCGPTSLTPTSWCTAHASPSRSARW